MILAANSVRKSGRIHCIVFVAAALVAAPLLPALVHRRAKIAAEQLRLRHTGLRPLGAVDFSDLPASLTQMAARGWPFLHTEPSRCKAGGRERN